jgi:hypothetical protein
MITTEKPVDETISTSLASCGECRPLGQITLLEWKNPSASMASTDFDSCVEMWTALKKRIPESFRDIQSAHNMFVI